MTLTQSLRHALNDYRRRQHLTERRLAASIGVDHVTIWRFLRGRDPSGRVLDAVFAFLRKRGVL
jgi:transcriptional regulator with XRE-family HTH domain